MKRALITGGSGGIGAAICRRLAAQGHEVLIHANQGIAKAEALALELQAAGYSARALAFDVTAPEQCTAALEQVLEDGPIQILVNNAGVHDDAVMPGMRAAQWHRVLDVSLNGFFNVTQPLLMPMIRTRWGRIVNISSVAALSGNRGQVNYAAAKAGLHGATKSLALELATRGITVNAVAPGVIETPMSEETFDSATIRKMIPMGRAGRPDEVAALVGFLCSDDAGYISAQVLSVNGALY
ncbi:3-oxoacyl-ACP reductase [Pandoraea terrae]|uniref:3-oxoacyl-ACP reductase n=1 Tax=Pandoraea terrae TaxID=1537710 RepID=A0A5E4S8H0_9BURK|nr:3-oxoacyl-ACP reductase FabG [Pandoraea terrae]VVD71363.1 3-oxoacyl-ACP reductase [Pandoraea terrae]